MTVYCFLKFFQEEQHARNFVAGKLHLKPLGYFKGLEAGLADGRADPHEAPLAWHQPEQLGSIEFAGVRIDAADLAAPLVIQEDDADLLNILCLYAAAADRFEKMSAANIAALREQLRVPERCRDLGPFVVLVSRPQLFINRFMAAVKRDGFGLECGLVSYFDPVTHSGTFEHPAFAKRKEFAWQREYRFAVERRVSAPETLTFDVGPLDDQCTIVDAARLDEPIAIVPHT